MKSKYVLEFTYSKCIGICFKNIKVLPVNQILTAKTSISLKQSYFLDLYTINPIIARTYNHQGIEVSA
jgi:hypothetical protein